MKLSSVYLCFAMLFLAVSLNACNGGNASSPIPSVPDTGTPLAGDSSAASQGSSDSSSTQATTQSTGTILQHIPTWAYDENWAEGAHATTAQVRQYVNYAEGGAGNSKAVTDCSGSGVCKSVFYMNANLIYASSKCPDSGSSGVVASAAESWYVHLAGYSDSAHRVHGTYTASCSAGTQSASVYVLNNANASVASYYKSYLQKNGNAFDIFFMDSSLGTVVDQMYGPGGGFCAGSICHTTKELPTDASVLASHATLANALTHTNGTAMQFVDNGLSFDGAQTPNNWGLFSSSSRFIGAVCENCVVINSTFQTNLYAPVLNTMSLADNLSNGMFILLSTGNAAAGSTLQVQQRIITTAMIWLGYKDGHTVVWPNLESNTQNLAVWPEDQIYPTAPVQSMTTGAINLQVSSKVWRREFGTCYNKGVSIGRCAAIVNGNTSAVKVPQSWLTKTYAHSITVSGGDVLSGGATKSVTFTAGTTSIPAGQGILLLQ